LFTAAYPVFGFYSKKNVMLDAFASALKLEFFRAFVDVFE